jgi:hypothetical protein
VQLQLNNLAADDCNQVLTDEVLQQLETEDKEMEQCHLSLATISGVDNDDSMEPLTASN